MAGRIPSAFIDDLLGRVDIVDVIDRRVPLTQKGREYMACCPFHEEKTPSFSVSPAKQFYHCFGCGAHGTAIGFLMEYGNLGFIEAVEELAEGVGLEVPREGGSAPRAGPDDSPQLLGVVAEARDWFQRQLREHADAAKAVTYLKNRGLDGKTAAEFGLGFAPDAWDDLARALGTDDEACRRLARAGLITQRDNPRGGQGNAGYYDRFRGRVIFPIEDHRGRVVGFGGRILGDGEPKYLNSPETPLFHKGAELYGLHRARREIGVRRRGLVVEGYMDVVGLAQNGVNYAVATLGTATTRTHLQRLFRLAPEVVFCFDGDRAGRTAAWKALEVSLPELQDGRQVSFLFLPEGEDPDSMVRTEGGEAFEQRVADSKPAPDFLFDTLVEQVDLTRMDGKARLVSLAKPLFAQMPDGALRQMMLERLSALSGLSTGDLARGGEPAPRTRAPRGRQPMRPAAGQVSPLALAISMLLQRPQLAACLDNPDELGALDMDGAEVLVRLVQAARADPEQTTARLLEPFRDSSYYGYLGQLAVRSNLIDEEAQQAQFRDTVSRLLADQVASRRAQLLQKEGGGGLSPAEKQELRTLLEQRAAPRGP